MSKFDKFFYYLAVIASFGTAYYFKVIILKAINDSKR